MIFSYGPDHSGGFRICLIRYERNAQVLAQFMPGVIYFFADLTTADYVPTRWYRVYKDKSCQSVWTETSDRDEAFYDAGLIGQPVYRLYERDVNDESEWRIEK